LLLLLLLFFPQGQSLLVVAEDVENEVLGDIATYFTCTTEKVIRVFFLSLLSVCEFSFSDELN